MINIMLVDDHQMLRDGLRLLVENNADLQVVADAGSGEEALEKMGAVYPDVIVLDLGMPGMGGFSFIKALRISGSTARIVVLSIHNDPETIAQAIRLGADGIVPKSATHTHLLDAIRCVHKGDQYLHPQATKAVFDELGERHDKAFMLRKLSKREYKVMELSARGYTSRAIGKSLSLSPKTIETYRRRIRGKLKLDTRADLVSFALSSGMLEGQND